MKKYYDLTITRHDGSVFSNPLRLGEAVLIATAARQNKSVLVEVKEMPVRNYNATFGTNLK